MTVSFGEFINRTLENPALAIVSILTLAVILVNGWTDAPNAIATCVATRSLPAGKAVFMAAVFNFLGLLTMSTINSSVAETIYNIADFSGSTRAASAALCAAMAAIVIWAVAAWRFGIPTSESHALVAGVSGAAIALQKGVGAINPAEWKKVLLGLAASVIFGFAAGWLTSSATRFFCRRMNRARASSFFKRAQICAAAAMSFAHGAQDGQKFMGVFLLGIFLTQGGEGKGSFIIPLWLMLLSSAVMAIGTSLGGRKIIKTVGMNMVKLERYQGFSADAAGALCILLSSLVGIPVSTTHTKTAAIMGVGASKSLSGVNWPVVKEMVLTWLLTFPGCGLIGFASAKIFIYLF